MPPKITLPDNKNKRMLLSVGLGLTLLLGLPIVALSLLDASVSRACTETVEQQGMLQERVHWQIVAAQCGERSYHDVRIGAEGRALATALTSSRIRPMSVITAENAAKAYVIMGEEKAAVPIRLRKTGSPAERIDYDRLRP